VKERSLKDEMRDALRGDRERAEERRRAEAAGEPSTSPTPPALDLNRPITELRRPAQPPAEPSVEAEPEPSRGLLVRLLAILRR
jgi:hypothetical protein